MKNFIICLAFLFAFASISFADAPKSAVKKVKAACVACQAKKKVRPFAKFRKRFAERRRAFFKMRFGCKCENCKCCAACPCKKQVKFKRFRRLRKKN